ncbi:MAG TPA: hypothetical protein VJN64_15145 [Terriglobales bacterium]|nr:hypothetical protein [Terriglobales bacterium]
MQVDLPARIEQSFMPQLEHFTFVTLAYVDAYLHLAKHGRNSTAREAHEAVAFALDLAAHTSAETK